MLYMKYKGLKGRHYVFFRLIVPNILFLTLPLLTGWIIRNKTTAMMENEIMEKAEVDPGRRNVYSLIDETVAGLIRNNDAKYIELWKSLIFKGRRGLCVC
ncbi:hypothetical protein LJR153_005558 [Paenibacillus sp. LjRoot153]|uniref:hypothetical protein n=1 Tax=Paenibacillus sp. LjRoot153 TaxID=3342270 RepID=UPI003ECF6998